MDNYRGVTPSQTFLWRGGGGYRSWTWWYRPPCCRIEPAWCRHLQSRPPAALQLNWAELSRVGTKPNQQINKLHTTRPASKSYEHLNFELSLRARGWGGRYITTAPQHLNQWGLKLSSESSYLLCSAPVKPERKILQPFRNVPDFFSLPSSSFQFSQSVAVELMLSSTH